MANVVVVVLETRLAGADSVCIRAAPRRVGGVVREPVAIAVEQDRVLHSAVAGIRHGGDGREGGKPEAQREAGELAVHCGTPSCLLLCRTSYAWRGLGVEFHRCRGQAWNIDGLRPLPECPLDQYTTSAPIAGFAARKPEARETCPIIMRTRTRRY